MSGDYVDWKWPALTPEQQNDMDVKGWADLYSEEQEFECLRDKDGKELMSIPTRIIPITIKGNE